MVAFSQFHCPVTLTFFIDSCLRTTFLHSNKALLSFLPTPSHIHKGGVLDLEWNLNGYWLATASRDTLVKVFDIRNMKELQLFRGHRKDVNGVCVHACVCA